MFVGADTGYVYALDQQTGCVHWAFQAQAGVRSAVTIGAIAAGRRGAFFGDLRGNVYALDAATGALVWTSRADDHAAGADHRVARCCIAIASTCRWRPARRAPAPARVIRAARSAAACWRCRRPTGAVAWKTYTITDPPAPTRLSPAGVQMHGPSGAGVWNAPTIDPLRNALYVGTGNNYSRPTTPASDAVMAMDLDTGKVLWTQQVLPDDAWIPACAAGAAPAGNCPENIGPDYDFGASPILKTIAGGRRLLISVAKSGVAWAMDPDRGGAVVWKTPPPKTPPGPEGEMVWGGAADDRHLYVGLTSGGVAAYRLATGEPAWTTPLAPADAHAPRRPERRGHGHAGDGVLRRVGRRAPRPRGGFRPRRLAVRHAARVRDREPAAGARRVDGGARARRWPAGWCSSARATSACAAARLATSCWRSV